MFTVDKFGHDLAPWEAAVRKVAKEIRVALIDLNADGPPAVQVMAGPAAADRLQKCRRVRRPLLLIHDPPGLTIR